MADNYKTKLKYNYWRKLPVTKNKFFKVMMGDYKQELKIPRKFANNFREKWPNWCTLRGESGKEWRVGVKKEEDGVYFSKGWKSFVKDHGVMEFDFLLFRYAGSSTFKVIIFDASGCEREESHFAKPSSSRVIIEEDNATQGSESQSSVDGINNTDDNDNNANNYHAGKQSTKCYISGRRQVSDAAKKRVCTKANDYIRRHEFDELPMVGITMLRTHVYKGLYVTIPKEWAVEHMMKKNHEVKLQVQGSNEYWLVGCRWIKSTSQCQLRPKWAKFVLDNNLEEGDVCVFTMVRKGDKSDNIRKERPVFNVRIFRVVDDLVPLTPTTA